MLKSKHLLQAYFKNILKYFEIFQIFQNSKSGLFFTQSILHLREERQMFASQ